jgi:L-fucose dehydrogenase
MDLQLKDKIVIVTGGANGIGAAIVRACSVEYGVPVIVDRDGVAGKRLLAELVIGLGGGGAAAQLIESDVSTPEACERIIAEVINSHGRIDALVNNVGINDKVGLEHGSPQEYAASLNRNVLHYYNMAHYALPHLKQSRGSIVNISSKTAVTGQGGTSGYAAAKGAILALTREWAVELADYGIRVNAVVPSEVMTPHYREWVATFSDPEEKLKTILSKIPLGKRMTTAEEIASAVLFLISPKSSHTTGQHIFVDGGYVHLDRALK